VLANAIQDQKIVSFFKFVVTTESTDDFGGGGVTNIGFLGGLGNRNQSHQRGAKPNALATSVETTFWIETVEYSFSVKGGNLQETCKAPRGDCGPTSRIPPTLGRSSDSHFTVNYTQLQYSQTILLDFFGLSWPHVTVGSLGEQNVFNLALPPDTIGALQSYRLWSTGWWRGLLSRQRIVGSVLSWSGRIGMHPGVRVSQDIYAVLPSKLCSCDVNMSANQLHVVRTIVVSRMIHSRMQKQSSLN
jgi:hypothetical protein